MCSDLKDFVFIYFVIIFCKGGTLVAVDVLRPERFFMNIFCYYFFIKESTLVAVDVLRPERFLDALASLAFKLSLIN